LIAGRIPGATLILLEHASHLFLTDQTEQAHQAILEFLLSHVAHVAHLAKEPRPETR
jgi:pimeloyl-ACP methyl ester carboxylesterase